MVFVGGEGWECGVVVYVMFDSDDIMIHICIYITLWCVFFSFPSSCSRVVERREGASDIGKRKHSAFTKQKGNGKKDKTKTKKKV